MGVKNDSTLVFNKYRVIFDPPLDGEGLSLGLGFGGAFEKFIMNFEVLYEFLANSFK